MTRRVVTLVFAFLAWGHRAGGIGRHLACLAMFSLATAQNSAGAPAAAPLRVALIAPDAVAASDLAPLQDALAKSAGIQPSLIRRVSAAGTSAILAPLRESDAAVFWGGPGTLGPADAALLREFLQSGKGLVVLAGTGEAWPSEPTFESDVLGATRHGMFAAGARMTVINLFPHPIFTGLGRFETGLAIPLFEKLTDDVQMIMEGTVGEATAPMAWVRRRPGGRVCHIVPADRGSMQDASFRQLIANAVRWVASQPIPGAQAAVQRTLMPDAYPGAFAITLPNGPGVCLDPVRGGINYIWDGDFVDLRPRWLTKVGEPARIFGGIYYREKEWQPLRSGAPDRESNLQFRGYTLQDGFPEFHYEVGGREIHERLLPGGDGHGLQRRFRVGPGAGPLWLNLESQPDAEVILRGLERDGNLATFASLAGGEFTIEIRPKAVTAR